MSSDVFFVLIRGFHHKKQLQEVVDWLEENVVLGHGEAELVEHQLPFEIPMGFPSREEAKDFVSKLEALGCMIGTESLSERKARAEKAARGESDEDMVEETISAVQREATRPSRDEQGGEPVGAREQRSSEMEEKDKKEEKATPKPWKHIAGIALAVGAVLAMALYGYQQMSDGDTDTVSGKVDQRIMSQLHGGGGSGGSFAQVVSNLQAFIEKQNYTPAQRVEHSTTYQKEVKGDKPIRHRETRQHNIEMLQVSIAFYRKNKDAWRRLVAEYQAIGASLKVEELRKEMVEIFGEEDTAEILAEESEA